MCVADLKHTPPPEDTATVMGFENQPSSASHLRATWKRGVSLSVSPSLWTDVFFSQILGESPEAQQHPRTAEHHFPASVLPRGHPCVRGRDGNSSLFFLLFCFNLLILFNLFINKQQFP